MGRPRASARQHRAPAPSTPPAPPRETDKRDGLIASQRTELDRLRRENKRLQLAQRLAKGTAPSRRAAALAALMEATRAHPAPASTVRATEVVLQPLTPPLLLARQMGAAVVRELREMTIETRRLVRALASEPAPRKQPIGAMDAPPADGGAVNDAQRRMEALKERYRQRFAALAQEWAPKMIAGVEAQSTAQLSLGLKDTAQHLEIHATMAEPRMRAIVEASTQSCTALITRIPAKYIGEAQIAVMSAITTGSGLDQLVPYLTEKYEGDARHARLTALDQVRKASENINAARVQALGSEEFDWIHTGGERYPRPLHQSYNGRRFRYDDLPVIDERTGIRGKPGDAIGCRCRQRAVFKFMREVTT